jgi:opacity protein-like surface antigen
LRRPSKWQRRTCLDIAATVPELGTDFEHSRRKRSSNGDSMSRSLHARVAFVLTALFFSPALARAQGAGTTYNLAGGWSLPTGSFGNFNDAGFALIGGLGFGAPGSPIRIRAEAAYNQFNHSSPSNESSRTGGFTGNAVYDFPMGPGAQFTPYGIGGLGFYGTRLFDNADTQWNIGWNIGGGVKFPLSGFSVYVEARYHSVSSVDVGFAPIVFGVVF